MVNFGVDFENRADWVYGTPVVPAPPKSKNPPPVSLNFSSAHT